jgi:hypothetical protein
MSFYCLATTKFRPLNSLGAAWVTLCLAVALHVADEATHDFLSYYNPSVLSIRKLFPWLPLPTFTFTFPVWISLLAVAIAAVLALTPLACRGVRWTVWLARVLAVAMALNALQHMAVSVYLGEFMPGVYSSPPLLLASLWLGREAWRARRQHG